MNVFDKLTTARRALSCLYLEAPAGVARDVQLKVEDAFSALNQQMQTPIPMILHCPACRYQHVDDDSFTEIHRSHLCRACLTVWRVADLPTIGVRAIETRGKVDTWPKT